MRARKKKWAAGELEGNALILRDESHYKGRLREFFGDGKPIHLELGCGKGRFVTEMSLANPDVRFIAMEREAVIIAAAARLAREKGVDNCSFVLGDAKDLGELLLPGDITIMYINFCDPWHRRKKRAKRRLTHDDFLETYAQLEIPEIHFKTDNRLLFEFSIESFSRKGWELQNVSLDLHKNEPEGNVMTEYEEKFSPLGPIYRLEAIKKSFF